METIKQITGSLPRSFIHAAEAKAKLNDRRKPFSSLHAFACRTPPRPSMHPSICIGTASQSLTAPNPGTRQLAAMGARSTRTGHRQAECPGPNHDCASRHALQSPPVTSLVHCAMVRSLSAAAARGTRRRPPLFFPELKPPSASTKPSSPGALRPDVELKLTHTAGCLGMDRDLAQTPTRS